jgi:endonuclease/exonuclease/phosphatase family metal-dependent hydrolase
MARTLRIATFNLENLDDQPGLEPPLASRIQVLRPQIERLRADILCLQEVNGQDTRKGQPRRLTALEKLLTGTPYESFERIVTHSPTSGGPLDRHNLVILSRLAVSAHGELRHDLVTPPSYHPITADPPAQEQQLVAWERPLLRAEIELPGGRILHLLNLHLKSASPSFIQGQKLDPFTWKTVAGWAEGTFLAAIKRAGQALEARIFVDRLFDRDPGALVAVCGDFNAEERETAVEILRGDEENTGNGVLAMRVLVPLERSMPPSQRYSVVHGGRPEMLDHLLVSRSLLAFYRGSEIHNEALGDELVAFTAVHGSPESYHAPVVAEFTFPEGR